MHTGQALYREGDYLGATVNVAARIAGQARRSQFLVTDDVRQAALGELVPLGPRRLKGVADAVDAFEARTANESVNRILDPVCGMELDPSLSWLRLSWQEREVHLCSKPCLELFVREPERYPELT